MTPSSALSMGRYADYVWPSYAITFVGLVWLHLTVRWRSELRRARRRATSDSQSARELS